MQLIVYWKPKNFEAFPVGSAVRICLLMQETEFDPWVRKIPWRREWLPTPVFFFFLSHSSILAWKILWTEEPGGLQPIGSQKIGHNWSDLACTRVRTHTQAHILGWHLQCSYNLSTMDLEFKNNSQADILHTVSVLTQKIVQPVFQILELKMLNQCSQLFFQTFHS